VSREGGRGGEAGKAGELGAGCVALRRKSGSEVCERVNGTGGGVASKGKERNFLWGKGGVRAEADKDAKRGEKGVQVKGAWKKRPRNGVMGSSIFRERKLNWLCARSRKIPRCKGGTADRRYSMRAEKDA